MRPRNAPEATFVDIVRDFMSAHGALRRIGRRWREGSLSFDEVAALVADADEEAVLFRLKERCHAAFRAESADVGRGALLDLAVGALFHECMKFRENFYQHAVYGPKVRALRASADGEADLFREFERIVAASRVRLEEALQEAELLLSQCRLELRALLRSRTDVDLVSRYLLEHRDLVGEVFEADALELLADVHGSPEKGLECAGRSYLASGYYREAADALRAALSRAGDPGVEALLHYAEGMQAYLERDYRSAVDELTRWIDGVELAAGGPRGPSSPADERLASLAWAAVSRIGQLVDEAGRAQIGAAAQSLAERIRPAAPPDAR